MNEKVKKAQELYSGGFNCCQAVAGAFCEDVGMDEELMMKVAGGFGGGLRCGEVCGAVSGAVMIIGLKYGQYRPGDNASKEKCGKVVIEFMDKYREREGEVTCRGLLGYDVRDSGAKAKNPNRQKEVCPKAIETAVLLLQEMGF